MYAIIKSGGKQYRVEKDTVLAVELLNQEEGSENDTDQIIFVKSGENEYKVGTPLVEGAKVTYKVLSHYKGKKVVIFKRKRRKGYRVKTGHRQQYTKIQISNIQC
ncbi:MAG: 50S ribosomal protein L21 [Deltaproteobacteria bacterium]|jgi:large subunit ribosomal protein L21|nr:50S ribosomal protein L21 [Deltaproteobacteria bacterium]MBT4527675.1 50S ribosomal protein L21 [Deltaproteobacteria bacterium]